MNTKKRTSKEKALQLLRDLASTVGEHLHRAGLTPEKSADVSQAVVDEIRTAWGGHPIYLPKGLEMDLERRDLEMWEAFNGHNHDELAERYGISVIHVYRVTKAVKARMIAQRQGGLFDEARQ